MKPQWTYKKVRETIWQYWRDQKGFEHANVPPIMLIPQNDPTTLFTGSGMQQFVPNLLGEPHPEGKNLFNIQPCFRSQDIEEIGDNRHTTFFEMIGNWSLGTYFKKEQLTWYFALLTDVLGLPPERLYVTVFKGHGNLPADEESIEIWKDLFKTKGITAEVGTRIFPYGVDKNWWSRAGTPDQMPPGEPGGPDSEVFFDFGKERGIHERSAFKDQACHPNCDCGRFVEIGNDVFMQYKKLPDGSFAELPQKNVDFGGGMERLMAALNDDPDIFTTELYRPVIEQIEQRTGSEYAGHTVPMRIIADHLKAATFLIKEGIVPSNKEQGYVLRRLLRRSVIKFRELGDIKDVAADMAAICEVFIAIYGDIYFDVARDTAQVNAVVPDEIRRFNKSLDKGLHELNKLKTITGKQAFDLYQSYGFPLEITEELAREKGISLDKAEFTAEFQKHKDLSRNASAGKFKGGLADASDQTLRYHTATHLLHQALFDVLGNEIRQEGSNITADRLRFDYYSLAKPTDEQLKQIEAIVNQKIAESLPMRYLIMPKADAEKVGAKSFFREKYPDQVKVYYIGGEDGHPETAYSKEFCGGPHVTNTKEIGHLEIYKSEKIGGNIYRIYAK